MDTGAAELWGFGIVGMVRAAADRWLEQGTMSRATVVRDLTELVWPLQSDPSAEFRRALSNQGAEV